MPQNKRNLARTRNITTGQTPKETQPCALPKPVALALRIQRRKINSELKRLQELETYDSHRINQLQEIVEGINLAIRTGKQNAKSVDAIQKYIDDIYELAEFGTRVSKAERYQDTKELEKLYQEWVGKGNKGKRKDFFVKTKKRIILPRYINELQLLVQGPRNYDTRRPKNGKLNGRNITRH